MKNQTRQKHLSHSDFQSLSQSIYSELSGDESLALTLSAEDSKFYRFNESRLRQATELTQIGLQLHLQKNRRQIKVSIFLGVSSEENKEHVLKILNQMRADINELPEDPYFVAHQNYGVSSQISEPIETSIATLEKICTEQLKGLDLAGLYCEGPLTLGMSNSVGLDHWFESAPFFFDYSLFHGFKAVKGGYAGAEFVDHKFSEKLAENQIFLERLKKPSMKIAPGKYRTYLAPAAANELIGMLAWGGFSYAALQRGQSSLGKIFKNEAKLSPLLTIEENFENGLVPRFNDLGELSPEKMVLIEKGVGVNLLTSSRSSVEYKVKSNGASMSESFRSPKVLAGTLETKDILKELHTGLYLSNLHYLNYSDMPGGRVTGMTRYACFWVENGEIIAPIEDLRFDESLYHCLGAGLIALTKETEHFPETSTYFSRRVGTSECPGFLIDQFTFTL